MTIESNVAKVRASLDRLSQYESMIASNNFEPDTVADIKGNAKNICNTIKGEVDAIKGKIDEWS